MKKKKGYVKRSLQTDKKTYSGTMHTQHVSNHVAELRKEQNLTQQELAEHIGVSRQTIISIERGNYTPSVLLALKLSETLNAPVEHIFSL